MWVEKEICYEDGGDICFKPTVATKPTTTPAKRVMAIGALLNGAAKSEMVVDAAMNGGKDGVVMLPEFNAVYVSEPEAMSADLDALRAEALPPIQGPQTLLEMYGDVDYSLADFL